MAEWWALLSVYALRKRSESALVHEAIVLGDGFTERQDRLRADVVDRIGEAYHMLRLPLDMLDARASSSEVRDAQAL